MNIIKRKLFIGIFSLIFLIVLFIGFSLFQLEKQQNNPVVPIPTPFLNNTSPNSASYPFSLFQKTIIGKTTDNEVNSFDSIINKESDSNNKVVYTVKSVNPIDADTIITQNGIVIYEKTSTFTDTTGGFPKTSSFTARFGTAEEEIQGSSSHGPFTTIYIYASLGFSFIGNPNTDEVYEVKRFLPTTIAEYKAVYGTDILTISPQPENL